jgi:predicted AlkP superfamily pyrophosphatase or phosphodiesterase
MQILNSLLATLLTNRLLTTASSTRSGPLTLKTGKTKTRIVCLSGVLLVLSSPVFAQQGPRLVLQITVDGMRADLLARYQKNFSKGGFNLLINQGTVYGSAHYDHANTETIVGHSTLATGAHPSTHGMTGNVWFDAASGELAYNIEDPEAPLLPTRETEIAGEQVDPSQKLARSDGRSPRALLVPTFSDSLVVHTAGKAKVFGISGKDRSAVAMAGHSGKAFWMSVNNGDFVSSRYYYADYPQWVKDWNGQRKAEQYGGKQWQLLLDQSLYLLGDQDDRPYEADLRGYGRVFPHSYAPADDKLFYTQVLVSPAGNHLLTDFAKTLITAEQLGQDDVPDYLSVSFSSVDAVNHFFGPSSLENEDVVLQLDRDLEELLTFVDKTVGLENTLIVLSADHGMAEMPEYMTELGYEAGRIKPEELVSLANKVAKDQFGIDQVARFFFRPYLYIDEEVVQAAGKSLHEVEQAIASGLGEHPGIALAVSSSGLSALEQSTLLRQIQRNYHPRRSGHIYLVQKPYWFVFESGPIVAMHGSPWRYDTHVPLIFMGKGINAQQVERQVGIVDVAPTLSRLLGLTPPASSEGTPLLEVYN